MDQETLHRIISVLQEATDAANNGMPTTYEEEARVMNVDWLPAAEELLDELKGKENA